MFNMSMGAGEHILRGVAVYVFLFLLLRFVGKKHVGELAPFDLLVLLILSETVQNSLVGDDTSLIGGLISATTLVLCAYGISFLTSHSKLAGRILEGARQTWASSAVRDGQTGDIYGGARGSLAPSRLR
jgi:uncharacterized membrane protein YcaP (DUF421 family)